jgi:hypothetical protein
MLANGATATTMTTTTAPSLLACRDAQLTTDGCAESERGADGVEICAGVELVAGGLLLAEGGWGQTTTTHLRASALGRGRVRGAGTAFPTEAADGCEGASAGTET